MENKILDRVLALIPAVLSTIFFVMMFFEERSTLLAVSQLQSDLTQLELSIGRQAGVAALERAGEAAADGQRPARAAKAHKAHPGGGAKAPGRGAKAKAGKARPGGGAGAGARAKAGKARGKAPGAQPLAIPAP